MDTLQVIANVTQVLSLFVSIASFILQWRIPTQVGSTRSATAKLVLTETPGTVGADQKALSQKRFFRTVGFVALAFFLGGLSWRFVTENYKPVQIVLDPGAGQIDTKQTGEPQDFTISLAEGEAVFGHADRFQNIRGCVAFVITGPGSYTFTLEYGVYYKWRSVSSEVAEVLLYQQINVLFERDDCSVIKIQREQAQPA